MIKNDVKIGQDGWLFLHSGGQRQYEHLCGAVNPTSDSIKNFIDNIYERKSYCEGADAQFMHITFPTKDLVLKKKLDPEYSRNMKSIFDRHYRTAFNGPLPTFFQYPLDAFIEMNSYRDIFHKLDTHLSFTGRLQAIRIILEHFGIGANPELYFNQKAALVGGDLAKMLGSSEKSKEMVVSPLFDQTNFFDNRGALNGNTNNIIICSNEAAVLEKTLLIIGDSFIALCVRLLSVFFRDVIYIRSSTFQKDAVDLFKPDFVISSNAERYLSDVKSDRDSHSILFSNYGLEAYRPERSFSEALRAQVSRRHHADVYKRWKRSQPGFPALKFDMIGSGFTSQMIEHVESGPYRFLSTGHEPQFIFHNTQLASQKNYVMKVVLQSTVDSRCTVYFSQNAGLTFPFHKDRALSAPVKVGMNTLSFNISAAPRGSLLRLDPLSCEGMFNISDISVHEF